MYTPWAHPHDLYEPRVFPYGLSVLLRRKAVFFQYLTEHIHPYLLDSGKKVAEQSKAPNGVGQLTS